MNAVGQYISAGGIKFAKNVSIVGVPSEVEELAIKFLIDTLESKGRNVVEVRRNGLNAVLIIDLLGFRYELCGVYNSGISTKTDTAGQQLHASYYLIDSIEKTARVDRLGDTIVVEDLRMKRAVAENADFASW